MAKKKQDWTTRGPRAQIRISIDIEGFAANGPFNHEFLGRLVELHLEDTGFQKKLEAALNGAIQPASITDVNLGVGSLQA